MPGLAAIMRTGMELRNAGPGRPPEGTLSKRAPSWPESPFAARAPLKLPRGALEDELSPRPERRRAILRGLEVTRPIEPTKQWSHCGAALVHSVLCHVAMAVGRTAGALNDPDALFIVPFV